MEVYDMANFAYVKSVSLPDRRDTGDRAQLRAEIDAYVAHLYGIGRDDFAYILDTFPVLKRKEEKAFGEYRYAKKLPGYRQSSYLLTKSLAKKPKVGVDTQLNRAVKPLISFSDWDSKAIERRQAMLARLAVFVWDMPGERIMPDAEDASDSKGVPE